MIEKVLETGLENIGNLDETLQARLAIDDELRIKVPERVLKWDKRLNGGLSFEEAYGLGLAGTEDDPVLNVIGKYKIARILIEDDRYHKPKELVENFIPESYEKFTPEAMELAKHLKGYLSLLLIKAGEVSPMNPSEADKKEEQNAAEYLVNKFNSSQIMDDLVKGGLPVEVIGQIITLEECSEMTDERKLEEFRSWAIHSLLRPYLKKLEGKRPEREFSTVDLMDRIPKQIFTHPYTVKYNLIANHFAKQLRACIDQLGPQKGIETIEETLSQVADPEKKAFLGAVYEEIYDEITYPYQGDFRDIIHVKGKERFFPCSEQAAFCYGLLRHNTRLFVADPGLGKTGGGFFGFENTDVEQGLIVAPAQVRAVWREQDQVVFNTPGNVFLIESSVDIDRAISFPNKYVALSRDLLGRTDVDPDLLPKLINMVIQRGIDGPIVDEIHNFTNPNAVSTRALRRILEVIHHNYEAKTGKPYAPVIGLTATPIRKEISDLNVPMAILYPDEFVATHAESTESKKTFSDKCLRNPHLTYVTLTGERRMFRWESGSKEFDYETLSIKASPFEELLADFINTEVGGDAINKIRLIENAYFNPLMVKNEVIHLLKGKVPKIGIDEAIDTLRKTLKEWKKMRGVDQPLGEEDFLSVDRLVELGLGNLVLASFFSGLPNGIDSLVEELSKDKLDSFSAELAKFWLSREISTKYSILKQQILDSLTWKLDEEGRLTREKVIVVSPARKQGRTGDVLQREVTDENGNTQKLYTESDLDRINDAKLVTLIREWTKGLCDPEDILLLDGSLTPVGTKRDRVISRFANESKAAVMVVVLQAASQGRDYTLNNLVDQYGRRIRGIHNIFINPPWDGREARQMIGRSVRQEHLVPVRNTMVEIFDSVEQGKGEAVRFTLLLDRIVLSGATLHPADQEFYDSKKVGARILHYRNPQSQFLRDAFAFVKGQDSSRIQEFFQSRMNGQEKTNAQILAERFYDEGNDAFKTTGYNAQMVVSLIRQFGLDNGKILSLGAGTLLLQRKLQRGIDNVDYNSHMMEAGWQEAAVYDGRLLIADAARLQEAEFPSGSYDFVDSAFSLDWAALGDIQKNLIDKSTRVQVLAEINRVLKNGGKLALTLPEKTLNEERLASLINVLEEYFGFKVDKQLTGKSYGVSRFGTSKRLGWSIVAQKVGTVDTSNLKLKDLEFCIDNRLWVSESNGKKNGASVVPREYPTSEVKLDFEQFKIVGLNGIETEVRIGGNASVSANGNGNGIETIVETQPEENIPEINSSEIISILRGQTKKEFQIFKKELLRPLADISGFSWTEAENYAINLLQEIIRKRRMPANRTLAYGWILKEARRQLSSK